MKIAYVAHSVIPSRTANSIHVFKMAAAMQRLGHDVNLIIPDKKEEGEKNIEDVFDFYGVNNFPFEYFSWANFKGSRYVYGIYVATVLLFRGTKIVYGRDYYVAIFSALFGLSTVIEFHNPPHFGSGLQGWLIKLFFNSSNLLGIVVISEALKNIFIEQGFSAEQLFVAHDGSDPMPDNPEPFGLKGDIKAGYVGHLYKGRGIENILYMAKENPDVHFHIAGGIKDDIIYWEKKSETLKNVHFHGFVPPKLTNSFRNECDILLAPYQREVAISGGEKNTASYMSPLKIFEYMAAEKPIICSDLPVLREILDEENALLCKADDVESWNYALRKLIKDNNLRIRLKKNAFNDFKNYYSWEKRAKRILSWVDTKL